VLPESNSLTKPAFHTESKKAPRTFTAGEISNIRFRVNEGPRTLADGSNPREQLTVARKLSFLYQVQIDKPGAWTMNDDHEEKGASPEYVRHALKGWTFFGV
jgi:hypothetical protein